MVATAARDGWNAVANKYLYKGRITRGEYRNHIVVGDHHILDVWAWDERQPFTNAGKPWLHRYWLSAWQDEATGVVAWALGERPNVRLLLAALYRYAMQFGMPVEIRTDNGKDYLSQEFIKFWQASGIEFQHKSLPSCRTGESHGKSKVIERWFGTFERGVMRLLPGWCGTHPKERPDDVLWPQVQEHKKYLAARYLNGPGMGGERPVHSPFLTREELDEKIAQWVSGKYHARATKRLDMTPLEAYQRDAHAVNRLTKEALLILMMRPRDRHILSNGVSIYGQHYWHSDFANLKGLACDVRIDPDDLSQVIVLINDGKKERALVAECSLPSGSSEDDLAEVKRRQKADRGVVRDYFEMQQRRLAGRRTWDEVLAEKAAKAAPLAEAVGAGPVVLPMTEGHRIAKALGQAGVRSQSPSGWGSPESRTPSPESRPLKLMPDLDAPPAHPSKPVFTTAWEKEQWEKEHPEDEQ
jgi:transposase InsO family protein